MDTEAFQNAGCNLVETVGSVIFSALADEDAGDPCRRCRHLQGGLCPAYRQLNNLPSVDTATLPDLNSEEGLINYLGCSRSQLGKLRKRNKLGEAMIWRAQFPTIREAFESHRSPYQVGGPAFNEYIRSFRVNPESVTA